MKELKNAFENIINNGEYDLTTLLGKIDLYHIENKLSDEEKNELYDLARKKPTAKYDSKLEIELLWKELKELKQTLGTSELPEDLISAWVQPGGAYNAYMKGDKVLFDGNIYISTTDNNVWSPFVYPSGWELLTTTEDTVE